MYKVVFPLYFNKPIYVFAHLKVSWKIHPPNYIIFWNTQRILPNVQIRISVMFK